MKLLFIKNIMTVLLRQTRTRSTDLRITSYENYQFIRTRTYLKEKENLEKIYFKPTNITTYYKLKRIYPERISLFNPGSKSRF